MRAEADWNVRSAPPCNRRDGVGVSSWEETSEDLSPSQVWGQGQGSEPLRLPEELPGGIQISEDA